MAEKDRRDKLSEREPIQERQGVREPQPLERGVESDRPERKVGDRTAGEGNEGEPAPADRPGDTR